MVEFRIHNSHQLLSLQDEQTELVLDALSTQSAREVLTALEDGPATVTELASQTDLTQQNTSYHLGKLTEADLVTATGTRGSGRAEATVYEKSTNFLVSTERGVGRYRLRMGVFGLLLVVSLSVVCIHTIFEPAAELSTVVALGIGLLHSLL